MSFRKGSSLFIYTAATAAVKLTPMVLLPVLTRRFSPEEYGILTAFVACLSIVEIVILMGGVDAIVRAYCDRAEDPRRFGRFVFNTSLVNAGVACLLMSVCLFFAPQLLRLLPVSRTWLYALPLMGFLMAFYSYPQKLAVFEKKPLIYSLFSGLYMFLDLGATLFFVFCLSWSWQGRLAGILVTRTLFFCVSLWYLKSRGFVSPVFDFQIMKESLGYGFPVLIHSLGFVALSSMDRLFLNAYAGAAATGIYGVAASLVGMTNIAITAFGLTWTPMLFERLKSASGDSKAYLVSSTYKAAGVMAAGMTVFALFVPFLLRFAAGEQYQSAGIHLYWLCAAALFNGLYVAVSGYIFYYKRVKLLALISLGMAGVGALLYPLLIRMHGAVGAAQANCAVFFVRFLAVAVAGHLICPMPWARFLLGGRHRES